MTRLVGVGVVALALLAAGCGSDGGGVTSTGATTTEPAETVVVKAYFLRDGKVWPVRREVAATEAVATAALTALAAGPTAGEGADFGFGTAVPAGTEASSLTEGLTIEDGVAHLNLPDLPDAALAQVVYTHRFRVEE